MARTSVLALAAALLLTACATVVDSERVSANLAAHQESMVELAQVVDVQLHVLELEVLMHKWLNVQQQHPDKDRALLVAKELEELREGSGQWRSTVAAKAVDEHVGHLLVDAEIITASLTDFDSYEDPMTVFFAQDLLASDGDFTLHCADAQYALRELVANAATQQGNTFNNLKESVSSN